MTNLQAALGLAQLEHSRTDFAKMEIEGMYTAVLRHPGLTCMPESQPGYLLGIYGIDRSTS